MPVHPTNIKGLTTEEVISSRQEHGQNILYFKKSNGLLSSVGSIVTEPMVILLLVAALIYLISGETGDALFMAAAILLISIISLYQEKRSRNALKKLQDRSQPKCRVIRNGKEEEIKSDELVVGDSLIIEEGTSVVADGIILQSNDFSVNESILTGESFAVFKDSDKEDNKVYSGTTVASGLAVIKVIAVGNRTQLGKIGKSLEDIVEEKTPLERQISNFVKKMVVVGVIVFIIVWIINYLKSDSIMDSLLQALTLAMSILPEEIPVAFTTFMALGAWRLMKKGIVVKQMKTVETLGSATVICTDKTGTITQNKMSLAMVFDLATQTFTEPGKGLNREGEELVTLAMWASEPIPFDPMEKALHDTYAGFTTNDERINYKMVHEYPLGGKPPMMTHIFEDHSHHRIIAAKGAPEALINAADLSEVEKNIIEVAVKELAGKGYRVLAIGEGNRAGEDFPEVQQEFKFRFKGLVAFYDPPKENIKNVLQDFYKAGIKVKIITGDNALTTIAIAKQIGFRGYKYAITGDELMLLSDAELKSSVSKINIFSRMFPEAKLKIVNALKANNEIVAMTGDGVNDGPALKAAHIGIAMGKKGTEIAKNAASLILIEDDLANMADAVAMGRKIYANLKKAIQYIISIHIPIIVAVFVPLVLGWLYPNIFSPLHVIFLELIMGPTCSVIYENEPVEKDTMHRPPRPFTTTFFNVAELSTSIIQGLIISAGLLLIYRLSVHWGYNEKLTRTMVFTTLVTANIFLTLVNRSFYHSILTTIRYKNPMIGFITGITIVLMAVLLLVPALTNLFDFEQITFSQLAVSAGAGFVSVIWYEAIKWFKRSKSQFPAP